MKKRLRILSLLIITALGMLAAINKLPLITVNATYVEGHIQQDTTWTLADSPFIVTKDLIVDANVTLTIMPGVEVRFGGNFILIVSGRLSAIGTIDKMITFTSNKVQPQPGDWNTIKFNSTMQSTVAYAVVKYSINGITIENGNVQIRNSRISENSQSGIYATGANQATIKENTIKSNQNGIVLKHSASGVNISNNELSSNTQNGVYLHAYAYAEAKVDYDNVTAEAKINEVSVSGNNIYSNGIGIYLHSEAIANASYYYYVETRADASIYDVTVSNNIIKSNTNSGIRVYSYQYEWLDSWWFRRQTQFADANAYTNVAILGNTLSANPKGIYVSGLATTNITRNSVSYSTFGFLFEIATDNLANFNDIYSNTYGMNVSFGAAVNAEYNYWGDSSGPYHISLNPSGKGNSVNGDGVNLDFIPFLTAPSGYVNERPVARLVSDKTITALDQPVTFDASTSSDDRRIDKYFFDFGDGKDSGWTTLSLFMHNYSLVGVYEARLIVMDDFGVTSNNNATVSITALQLPPLQVSFTLSRSSVRSEGQISIAVHVTNGTQPVENADIKLVSNRGGSFAPATGYTNATGDFATTFTAPNVAEQTNVRITATASKSDFADGSSYQDLMVLPPTAPTLSVQIITSVSTVKPLETLNVTVHVTHDGSPVPDATVTISSNEVGNFSVLTGNTDSNGDFNSTFRAPQTTTQINVTITATAIKSGYFDGSDQTTIIVNPEESGQGSGAGAGLTLTTILLILIPVVVVAIVAVLIVRNRRAMKPPPVPVPAPVRPPK